ncbi:MAG: hypothetical protein GY845_31475 [Planctomycetes bacterium]|nr:hypothetical protein [Planctomycetota bacterium]
MTGIRLKSDKRTALPVTRMGLLSVLQPNWRLSLAIGGYILAMALCGLVIYLWQAPLPSLAIPQVANAGSTSQLISGRAGSKAALEICLRQVKMRDMFKPSIPVPTEGGIAKSTAQELADRLQYVGIVEEAGKLAALVFIPNRGPGTFHIGDKVAEFVLKDVMLDRLILELGDEEAILKR